MEVRAQKSSKFMIWKRDLLVILRSNKTVTLLFERNGVFSHHEHTEPCLTVSMQLSQWSVDWTYNQTTACSFPCRISPIASSSIRSYHLFPEALCSRPQWKGTDSCSEVQKETFISKEAAIKSTGVHRLATMSWAELVTLTFGSLFTLTEERCYLWLRSGLLEERWHDCIKEIHVLHWHTDRPFLYLLSHNLIFTRHIN